PLDMVRSLEIVTNCHEFDPFPPLDVHFAMSTDKVPLKKRDVGFERPIRANGPWTPWSVCTLRTRSQVRSQPCEYGRHVQRRRCPHHVPVGTVSSGFVQPSSNYMLIAIPYPPTPYVHPSIQTEEYAQIMAVHQEQVQKSCCYRQQYVHQQLQQYPIGGAVQQVNYAMPAVPACPRPCAPFAGVGSPPWQQTGGTATVGQGALQHVHYQAASLLQYPPETTFVNQQQPHPHTQPHLQPQPYPQPQPQPQLQPQTQRYPQPQPQAQPYPQPEPQPLHPTLGHPIYEPGPQQVYYPSPQLEHLPSPQPSGEPLHHPQRPNGDKDVQPRLHETRPAPIQLRPPVWGEWSEWSACSGSCDIGTQQRYRKCETTHAGCEGEAVQQRPCEDIPFCETWAPWSEWSACRATCGSGERSRSRHCHLGKSHCDGLDFEVEACDAGTCPGWSAWEAWSDCTVTCGQGTRRRMRTCERGFCQGERYEEGACENAPCSHWADWQEWSYCSVSCGSGTKSRHRICIGNYCEVDLGMFKEPSTVVCYRIKTNLCLEYSNDYRLKISTLVA
uniref:Apple domain-containing protein n=1 Tax=Parascaris univalens TaxID=6257 RepID=A0A915AWQ8_PARUN